MRFPSVYRSCRSPLRLSASCITRHSRGPGGFVPMSPARDGERPSFAWLLAVFVQST